MRPSSGLLAAAAALLCAGCDNLDPIEVEQDPSVLTVDASAGWAFVRLTGDAAEQVSVADAASSSAWDIAFNATRVMLNGGAAGPGDVAGYCVCGNATASDAQVQAMTPAGERADFEAVTLADVPAEASAWEPDALDPAIAGWYTYDMATHTVVANPSRVWKVRGAGSAPE